MRDVHLREFTDSGAVWSLCWTKADPLEAEDYHRKFQTNRFIPIKRLLCSDEANDIWLNV